MDGENLNGDEVLLPGFRFHPTDEELVGFYLKRKIKSLPLSIEFIRQLDIYKYDPWDLPKLAMTGEKEWYFYCPRDRKYRNSMRPNRVTKAGFWKATDRPIYSSHGSVSKCIGLKKSLVFYRGRAAKGIKTDWMMHEFRLPSPNDVGRCSTVDADKYTESWAICRVFRKTSSPSQRPFILTTRINQPPSTQPPIKYDCGVDENNVAIIDLQRNQQEDAAKLNPIIEEPCRPSFSNDGHYYSLDPTKLAFPTQLDNISLALPSMPYSILGDDHNPSNDSVIPHLPSGVQTKGDIVVGQHGCGNDGQLPLKGIKDGNGEGETREDMYMHDFDLARCSTGSTRGDENAWISSLIWDYDLSSWPKYCELPYYRTDCYT